MDNTYRDMVIRYRHANFYSNLWRAEKETVWRLRECYLSFARDALKKFNRIKEMS